MADDAPMPSLATQVTWIVVGYAVLVVLLGALLLRQRAERPPWLDQMLWMLELLLVVRALVGIGPLTGDDPPASVSTYVGYLLASVCVLPLAMRSVAGDRGVWSTAVVTIAAIAVGVLVVRVQVLA